MVISFILAADDEISFDPDDIVTNIEMVSIKVYYIGVCKTDGLRFIFYIYAEY